MVSASDSNNAAMNGHRCEATPEPSQSAPAQTKPAEEQWGVPQRTLGRAPIPTPSADLGTLSWEDKLLELPPSPPTPPLAYPSFTEMPPAISQEDLWAMTRDWMDGQSAKDAATVNRRNGTGELRAKDITAEDTGFEWVENVVDSLGGADSLDKPL